MVCDGCCVLGVSAPVYNLLVALAVIGLVGELLFLNWLLLNKHIKLTTELANLFRIIVLGLTVLAVAGLLGINVSINIILSGAL